LANVPLGFDQERALVVNVNATRAHVAVSDRVALFGRLVEAAAAAPGVAHAAASVVTPVSGSSWRFSVAVPGAPEMSGSNRSVFANYVTPDWFASYGTPLVAGRLFDARDTVHGPQVVIVNEKFTRTFFPNKNALGGLINYPSSTNVARPPREIVGVVGDAVYRNLRDPIAPTMYIPLAQYSDEAFPLSGISITVRATTVSPSLLARGVAAALTAVDRDLAFNFRLLSDQIRASLVQERLVALLSGFFGGLALLLAALGLYGITSYAVSRRRTEIGIRMALGAASGGVVRLVLRRVALLVGAGVVIGTAVCLWAAKFVATLLYGLEPRDPATLVSATLILVGIGAAAGWVPAYRASRIDPAEVLRDY
jgi:putative ABC transport system permease protein